MKQAMSLGDFKGIGKGRKKVTRQGTLYERAFMMLAAFRDEIPLEKQPLYFEHGEKYKQVYELTEASTEDFSEDDLRKAIQELADYKGTQTERMLLGMYTGSLLEIMTRRNKQTTRFYINGEGRKFDFLFCGAFHIDEVIIDNFRGDYIAYGTAALRQDDLSIMGQGTAKTIAILNCEGKYIGNATGANAGRIQNLYIINCKGDNMIAHAAHRAGVINMLIANNESNAMGGCHFANTIVNLNNRSEYQLFVSNADRMIIGNCEGRQIALGAVIREKLLAYRTPNFNPAYLCQKHMDHPIGKPYDGTEAVKKHLELTGIPFGDVIIRAEQMQHKMTAKEIMQRADWIVSLYAK